MIIVCDRDAWTIEPGTQVRSQSSGASRSTSLITSRCSERWTWSGWHTRGRSGAARSSTRRLHFVGEQASAQSAAALRVVAEEIADATPDPFLVLRHVRLTRTQAEVLTATLTDLVEKLDEAGEDEVRFGVLMGV